MLNKTLTQSLIIAGFGFSIVILSMQLIQYIDYGIITEGMAFIGIGIVIAALIYSFKKPKKEKSTDENDKINTKK